MKIKAQNEKTRAKVALSKNQTKADKEYLATIIAILSEKYQISLSEVQINEFSEQLVKENGEEGIDELYKAFCQVEKVEREFEKILKN